MSIEPTLLGEPAGPEKNGMKWGFLGGLLAVASACLLIVLAGVIYLWVDAGNTPCGGGDWSTLDVLRVRQLAWGKFEAGLWTQSLSTKPFRIDMEWISSEKSAAARLEYLLYNCGYKQSDIDTYYSEDNFNNVLLSGYQHPVRMDVCSQGSLTHYEYSASYSGRPYLIYYWVRPDSAKRVLGLFMAFPETDKSSLLDYGRRFFPTLPACALPG
jgi:hypothetical protein